MVLDEVGDQVHDPLNYGFYLPPEGGRAGKFMDEERPLEDYKLHGKAAHTFHVGKTTPVVCVMARANPLELQVQWVMWSLNTRGGSTGC